MKEEFFEKLKEKVQSFFDKGGSHAFDHTQRVLNLALRLAKKEKDVDLDVLKTAAILHDICRKKEDEGEVECHAEGGCKLAEEILKETDFSDEKIKEILHAIRVHRHSKGLKAENKEAEILQDADRLDALGAITIARMFSTGGKMDRPLHNPQLSLKNHIPGKYSSTTINGFYQKIFKIKPESFNTKEAKKIAKERYKYVKEFVDRFLKEWDGKL